MPIFPILANVFVKKRIHQKGVPHTFRVADIRKPEILFHQVHYRIL